MDNDNVVEVISLQNATYLKFGRSPEKVMACISLGYMLSLKFGWNWMKIVEQQTFENVNIRHFAKCNEWPQEAGMESTLHDTVHKDHK